MSHDTHRKMAAGGVKLRGWVAKLEQGMLFEDEIGARYEIIFNSQTDQRIHVDRILENGERSKYSNWTYDDFIRLSLDRKFERICRHCHRKRKEHLKKAKCLFGATSWA